MNDRMTRRPETTSTRAVRGNTYKLLAECYQRPDGELVETVKAEARSGRVDPRFAEVRDSLPEDVESLKVDYGKLFAGPFEVHAPPYGSVYLEGERRVMGESTRDAARLYREAGVDIDFEEPPDHVAAELEFVYYLLAREIGAAEEDADAAAFYLHKRKEFLETHLGSWVGEFSRDVEENSETAFYEELAQFTRTYVNEEIERLPDDPTPEDAGTQPSDAEFQGGEDR